jgi:glycosyltransferase involved in cell wall biosynthesis
MPTVPKPALLSVLLPCYRAQQTVQRAIDSVQCEHAIEIVLAPDDGSLDYAYLADRYPGVVTVLPPSLRSGPGAARNRAFAACIGQFITLLDADDCFAPGAVAEALQMVQASAQQIAFFRTDYVDAVTGTVSRELPLQAELCFADFVAFHGSVHAIYARRHWQDYVHLHSEDVLHDAQLLLAAGARAPLTHLPYLLQLNAAGLCASTAQDVMNRDYRCLRDAASDPLIQQLYQAKLDMGLAFAQAQVHQPTLGFHDFVQSQAQPG